MVVNGRPIKRMKRRVTADLYNFLTFPASSSSSPPPPDGPFRANVRSFLTEHALLSPPSSLFPHLLTWQISFRVGDLVECGGGEAGPEVVSLDVVEEDVARSRSVYCDQCRVVGWSEHPVCCKRYHFVIKADGNSIDGYHKLCSCCGNILHLSESRCKTCNHVMTADDVEEWVYHQLEDTTHLLHGVIHANGYGHLLRVNGKEGGSRVLSGCHIMDFWDRLCKSLGVRKVSVMDVSKKYGIEYRLLHAITKGHSWYGDWGYEFGAGSFGLTADAYKSAVETLSNLPLSIFIYEGRKTHTRLQDTIKFYQSLSDRELVNTRDLFCYLTSLIHDAHKSASRVDDSSCKKRHFYAPGISPSWTWSDIERVEEAMFRVLRAVSGSNWVSWRALRGAVFKVAPPELLDHCLKELGGKFAADGVIVRSRCNPSSGAFEYRLEPGNPSLNSTAATLGSTVITCPSEENLIQDLRFLYENILLPQTMLSFGPRKLLDCKQFMKDYNKCETTMVSVEIVDQLEENVPNLPPETVVLPSNATVSDLKREASRAFQDVYLMLRRFDAEELLGHSGVDDSTQVKLLVRSTESVRLRGRCLGKNGLGKFRMERGTERWTVDCCCGAKDDDGERMLACDVCGVWQHTRCSGIPDSDSVPAKFVCLRCRGSSLRRDHN
ncbi:PHD finger protein [Salix suchowensis]|nr:PHD finger protein [Salix suchowensis]